MHDKKTAGILSVARNLANARRAYINGKNIVRAVNPFNTSGEFGLIPLAKEIAKAKMTGWLGKTYGNRVVSKSMARKPKGFLNALAFGGYRRARKQSKDLENSLRHANWLQNASLAASLANFLPNKLPGSRAIKNVASRFDNKLNAAALFNSGRLNALNNAKMRGQYASTSKELLKSLGAWGTLGGAVYAGKRGIDYLTTPGGMVQYYPNSLPYNDPYELPMPNHSQGASMYPAALPAPAPRYPMMITSQPSAPIPVQRGSAGMYPMGM